MNIKNKSEIIIFSLVLCISAFIVFDIVYAAILISKYIELGSLEAFNNWLFSDGGTYKGSHYSKGAGIISGIVAQIPIVIIMLRKIKNIKI